MYAAAKNVKKKIGERLEKVFASTKVLWVFDILVHINSIAVETLW